MSSVQSSTPRFGAVVVVALPPPLVGQSLASVFLADRLQEREDVAHHIVDLTRPIVGRMGLAGRLRRAREIATLSAEIVRAARRLPRPRVFYLQLSWGKLGLVRDLVLVNTARLLRLPTVIHIHGGGFRASFDAVPRSLQAVVRQSMRRLDAAIVLEEPQRAMLESLVDDAKIRVVPNAVADHVQTAFQSAPIRDTEPGEPLKVLFLSNLMENKGHDLVLDAALESHRRGLGHEFVIAGARADEMKTDPDRFIAEHGLGATTSYLGPVYDDDKVDALRNADVFALPSRYLEGQPIAVLEAMMAGMPVVGSTLGGIPGVFEGGEQLDLLFDPNDPDGGTTILGHVERLAADPERRRRLGQRNHDLVIDSRSSRVHADRVIDVLEEIAGCS